MRASTKRRVATPSESAESGTRRISLAAHCERRLEALCRAAGFGEESTAVVRTFHRLIEPWADRPVGLTTPWVSEISDDNTPVELSAAISEGRVQVRVLLEAQADEPTVAAHRRAALAFTERLESDHGAHLGRFHRVADLFLPEDMRGPFALWHSAVFDLGRPPTFKAYFNPQARGPELAPALVEEGLSRLGMADCWAAASRTARRGPHLDELKYFALDLTAEPTARVKVYVRHHGASAGDLERACSGAADYVPGEVREFVRAMGGDHAQLSRRAPFSCSAFHDGSSRPSATTVYVPVCAYADDDAAVEDRVSEYLSTHGMDPAAYHALLAGYAERPLDAGVGMQSWVAFRRLSGARLTVYLATEAGAVYPRGSVPAATGDRFAFETAEELARCLSSFDLTHHPCLRRLRREGGDAGRAWALVRAAHKGTSKHAGRWEPERAIELALASGALRAPPGHDVRESVLSEVEGTDLLAHLLEALEPLRPSTIDGRFLDAGRRLADRIHGLLSSTEGLERLAALATLATCAHQLAEGIEEMAALDGDAPAVRALREALDRPAHPLSLLACVARAPEAIAAYGRGSAAAHAALWSLLDELYPTD